MLERAKTLWTFGLLCLFGGVLGVIGLLQFAELLPWAGAEATYIGGAWTGVVAYALVAIMMFGAAWGWFTVKRWAPMITILAALIGFFIPFISYMDETDPRSSAMAPVIVSVVMLFLVFRPSTNRVMAAALADRENPASVEKTPPKKPMSAARKRELADEQAKAIREQVTATPAIQAGTAAVAKPVTTTSSSSPNPAVAATTAATAAAATAVANVVSALPKPAATASMAPVRPGVANLARSAASLVGVSSRAPAKPAPSKPASAPRPVSNPSVSSVPAQQRPAGFRADDV